MPRVAANTIAGGGRPGVARNMPITATNTMSETTRGLVSARNWRNRILESVATAMAGADDDETAAFYASRSATL